MIQSDAKALIGKFIYGCSHDLRGPVAAIQGLVKLVEEYPDQVEPGNCIRMIGECSDKLDQVLSSLRQFLIDEEHKIQPEIVDPTAFVEDIVELYEYELSDKSITVERQIDVKNDWVIDRFMVSLILKHLLANAIYFSDPAKDRKRIYVKIRDAPHASYLTVTDNGLGISREFRLKVFDLFYRAHEVSKGPGMGLFLVKHLVMKMGGRIQLSSKVRQGTAITIVLPLLK